MKVPELLLPLLVLFVVLSAASTFGQATDLVSVVSTGTAQDVQAAIANGADINYLQPDTGCTPLIAAAKYNQDVIAILLKGGADTSAHDKQYGATALMWAAVYAKTPAVINELLEAGADIKAMDGAGGTVLMWAAEFNSNPEIVQTLLSAGADVNVQDNQGQTPLIHAAKGSNSDVVMLLLGAGADMKVKDKLGNTALIFAKYNAKLDGTVALKKLEEALR